MGSQPSILEAALVPKHAEPCPEAARLAAAPYFSCTTSLMFWVLIEFSFLLENRNDVFGRDHAVPGAALRVQKAKKILQRVGVRAIPEERPFAAYLHQALVLELLQVV